MAIANHEVHEHRILDHIQTAERITQRALSRELGIALGLTNLLVRRLVKKGWVRIRRVSRRRVLYLITPAGLAEKTRLSRAYFQSSVHFYKETRERIREQFAILSATRPASMKDRHPNRPNKIVFYGAGEVAEIGYVCLGDTDLELVGVVDPDRTKPFFHMPIRSPEAINGLALDGQAFDWLVVMSFGDPDTLQAQVLGLRIPADRVFWL